MKILGRVITFPFDLCFFSPDVTSCYIYRMMLCLISSTGKIITKCNIKELHMVYQ